MVTEPKVGVSTIILPTIEDNFKPNLSAQSSETNECVASVSILAIKGMLFINHIPQIKQSALVVYVLVKVKTLPPDCALFHY